MPLPLVPLALSVAGGVLPGIVSALVGSKTPEQARRAVAPQYDAMVSQLVGRGMTRTEAQAQADEAIKGAVQEKMQEGALPGWAEALLSVAGGIGGWAAGAKLAAKGAAKALAKEVPKAAAIAEKAAPVAGRTKGELPAVDDPPQGLVTPFGPKPPPRKSTPLNEDLEPSSLPKSGDLAPEFGGDEIADALIPPTPVARMATPQGAASAAERDAILMGRQMSRNPLPDDLLPPFARMASRIEADDRAAVARRLNRY